MYFNALNLRGVWNTQSEVHLLFHFITFSTSVLFPFSAKIREATIFKTIWGEEGVTGKPSTCGVGSWQSA